MKDDDTLKIMRKLTMILRESDDALALVKGIRNCLEKINIEPNNVIVAEWFPDDVDFEYGIIINRNKKIFQFGY